MPLIYDLDPDHGFLPRKIGGAFATEVTKFALMRGTRVEGLWFPVGGTGRSQPEGRARFEVLGLEINQAVPGSRFQVSSTQ